MVDARQIWIGLVLLVLGGMACGCGADSDTLIVVATHSDLLPGTELSRVRVETYDVEGKKSVFSSASYRIAEGLAQNGEVRLPFLTRISKGRKSSFLLAIKGYGALDGVGPERLLVEYKAKLTFHESKSVIHKAFLGRGCVDRKCLADASCYARPGDDVADGVCGGIEDFDALAQVSPGAELDPIEWQDRADSSGSTGGSDGGIRESDGSSGDAGRSLPDGSEQAGPASFDAAVGAALDAGSADAGDAALDAGAVARCAADPSCDELQISVGATATCAVTAEHELWCWGEGEVVSSPVPEKMTDFGPVEQVSVGAYHACVRLLDSERLICWGFNGHLQLGSSSGDATYWSAFIEGLESVSAGIDHTCVVASGQVRCWGANFHNELGGVEGDGNYAFDATRSVKNLAGLALSGVVGVAAGGRINCAVQTSGAVSCWGGQWRNGRIQALPLQAVADERGVSLQDAKSLCAEGEGHFSYACALRQDGSVACWGTDPAWMASHPAASVADLPGGSVMRTVVSSGVEQIACGQAHVCVRTSAGEARCWGVNGTFSPLDNNNPMHRQIFPGLTIKGMGGLGVGTFEAARVAPTAVLGLPAIAEIYAGQFSTCAKSNEGDIYCWGANDNLQLGLGSQEAALSSPHKLQWP